MRSPPIGVAHVCFRFAALLAILAAGYVLGTIPASEANLVAKLGAVAFLVTVPALYLLPTYEAWKRGHGQLASIAALNVFFGWTLLGWVGALVWAFAQPQKAGNPQT